MFVVQKSLCNNLQKSSAVVTRTEYLSALDLLVPGGACM